jgi:hypothetical protein
MADSLSQSSSWLTVDADTYRYFFSASAQVFAAIFAIVAIAYSLKIIIIHRQIDNLRREKIGKAILYKENWGYNYLNKKLRGHLSVPALNEFKERVSELDDWTINEIIESIKERCHEQINGFQSDQNQNAESIAFRENKIKYFHEVIASLGNTKAEDTKREKQNTLASNNVVISVISTMSMVVLSLIILWFEWYESYFVIIAFLLFTFTIIRIGYLFVQTFSDSQPTILTLYPLFKQFLKSVNKKYS